jgi:hypothetical protein
MVTMMTTKKPKVVPMEPAFEVVMDLLLVLDSVDDFGGMSGLEEEAVTFEWGGWMEVLVGLLVWFSSG